MKRNLLPYSFVLPFFWLFLSGQSPVHSSTWIAPAYTDTLKNPYPDNELLLKEGKKIYDNICWTCHGLSGKGDGPASVTLNPKPANHTSQLVQQETDGSIFWKISNGRGNMQPYGKIYSAKQRWGIVNYIRVLGKNNNR